MTADGGAAVRYAERDVDRLSVRTAVRRFAVGSLVTLAILTVAALLIGGHIARKAAIDEAEFRAQAIADNIAAPLVTPEFRAHDKQAVAILNRLLLNRMRDGSVQHIKIWSVDGVVLWSDEKALVGRRFPVDNEAREALDTFSAVGNFSDLSAAENAMERGQSGSLVEVYVGTRAIDGQPMIFETYLSTERIAGRERSIVTSMLAVSVGALVLFAGTVLPLSVSLARRVRRGRDDREQITHRALMSSELERRRIAQELHDGVVQDLAGIGYVIPGLVRRLRDQQMPAKETESLERINDLIKDDVAELRSLMTTVYPANLADHGLSRAVWDLVMDSAGSLFAEVAIEPDLPLPQEAAQMAYRVLREGLRNVLRHAGATSVRLETEVREETVHIVVSDDGVGLPAGNRGNGLPTVDGHFGLRLLEDSLHDIGGALTLRSGVPNGVRLEARFPLDLVGV